MRERKALVRKTDRSGVRFLLTKSQVLDNQQARYDRVASMRALPLAVGKPILAIRAHEQEEAVSFGLLYERANVSW